MQTKHENRLLFLKLFTHEIIANIKPDTTLIKEELKFPSATEQPEQIEIIHSIQRNLPMPAFKPLPQQIQPKPSSAIQAKPLTQTIPIVKPLTMPIEQMQRPRIQPQLIQPSMMPQPEIQPDLSRPLPENFTLEKLDALIKDPKINMIECLGPGKPVLVRALGKIKATKISLDEQEIKNIIEAFSEQARIPIMTGIFKAAVGNLLITAIISEFVGSRFIITKRIG